MNLKKKIGMNPGDLKPLRNREDVIKYINFKLAMMGQPGYFTKSETNCECNDKKTAEDNGYFIDLFEDIIDDYKEKNRLLSENYCPADKRIQDFIDDYFKDTNIGKPLKLIQNTLILDQHGLARELSLPPDQNEFCNEWISSYRIKQGILHNPKNDRRTTKGVFHICEGGLPVPFDKKEVPKTAFANMFFHAVNPPESVLELPFTSSQSEKAKVFCSVLYKPLACPEVEGVISEKRMEIRGFVPGSCISTIDFGESIFGNEGDPFLIENDSALNFDHWTGTTGCMIIAPHLVGLTKKELGLPSIDKATERQKRDGMCWTDVNELYNEGQPFKLTCRDHRGVVITLIADNYFGYWKKEIKTQLTYSSNIYGLTEEEHAGGTLAFPRYNLGEIYEGRQYIKHEDSTDAKFETIKKNYGFIMDINENCNYGVDKTNNSIIYLPEDAQFDLNEAKISWSFSGKNQTMKLLPGKHYILPNGYQVHMEKHPSAPAWKLIGTSPEGTFCHKPCTVSGGGKSEISKSLDNSIIYGRLYVNDLQKDLDKVEEIIAKDYSSRWISEPERKEPSRKILSPKRSLGSVIKLLTPSSHYKKEFNEWLVSIPNYIKSLVFLVKRFYVSEWGDNWREHFTVDIVNGKPGHELNFNGRAVRPSYLRVGFDKDGSWCIYKLRMDFKSAAKVQMEDDISVSITIPKDKVEYPGKEIANESIKIIKNCEYRLFQRPDDCVVRGFDKQAEADLSSKNVFVSNFEPYKTSFAQELIDDAVNFDQYTAPVKDMIKEIRNTGKPDEYFIAPSHPRLVGGSPTKNVRYLQVRPDFIEPVNSYLAEIGTRLYRKVPLGKPVVYPVNSVLSGRRNNPPDKKNGFRPLCVYNPIHFQELPELFMDFVASLTGKSPSTTGAGSEGALTKGPFNMLVSTSDLNNALLSYILTGYHGYSSAAGHIGPDHQVDHDISMLVPEIWCKLSESERDAYNLIKEGSLEKLEDFEYDGKKVLASRLGYRITEQFLYRYMGRIFDEPQAVFNEKILKPEVQDMEAFVDGINNITEAQQKIALEYFSDNSVNSAIPPLKALLHIMAYGEYNGKTIADNEIRNMFTREAVISSEWYKERLILKQKHDQALYERHTAYIKKFIENPVNAPIIKAKQIFDKLSQAEKELERIKSDEYLKSLYGTIGLDPLHR